jgi:hypothetical protein
MLHGPSKQIAHCYFRAAECGELAARSGTPTDRQLYLAREKAWLALARRYECQKRLVKMIKELERRCGCLPSTQDVCAINIPKCSTCSVEMQLQTTLRAMRGCVQSTMVFDRAFFLCPNCGQLSD